MREILFKGRTDYGLWVYGQYHNTTYVGYPNGGDNKITRHYILPQNAGDALVVIPETVGQFTGLTDKNGVKIFEGDIIRAKIESGNHIGFTWPNMPVGFQQGSFCLNDSKGYVFCTLGAFAPSVTLEVIGNIHDNPELLNGGGDLFEDKTESGLLEE